jgi:hypothetical protein
VEVEGELDAQADWMLPDENLTLESSLPLTPTDLLLVLGTDFPALTRA